MSKFITKLNPSSQFICKSCQEETPEDMYVATYQIKGQENCQMCGNEINLCQKHFDILAKEIVELLPIPIVISKWYWVCDESSRENNIFQFEVTEREIEIIQIDKWDWRFFETEQEAIEHNKTLFNTINNEEVK